MARIQGDHIQAQQPIAKELNDFISSGALRSVTRYINAIKITFENKDRDEEQITLVDTPGFGDTQSVEVDISNTIGIVRSAIKAKQVYPVLLFSKKNQGGRSEILKQQIEFYSSMIKDNK